ncbi:hypothetical protein MATL_G00042420 [Megalops atlanticus]|uniref:Yippee domain-containing protein n=1 Tax=Megalops atlanticus TaxID=7932 RepID=A0A9D3QA77_MEGAT|nr:hypothetical protein MATL_G00042420 [Megalops atlanticus]
MASSRAPGKSGQSAGPSDGWRIQRGALSCPSRCVWWRLISTPQIGRGETILHRGTGREQTGPRQARGFSIGGVAQCRFTLASRLLCPGSPLAVLCLPPAPRPTTALTCVLRCFPCEPSWAGSPFLHRPATPPVVRMTRSKTFQAYLPSCHRTYSCIHCRAHLANHDELISKSFQGSQGRAYLFNSVVNVGCGPAEERVLLTGLHAVADIYCENCKTTLGWKYEHAFESSQKYKEGKFIIELAHMIKDNGWD